MGGRLRVAGAGLGSLHLEILLALLTRFCPFSLEEGTKLVPANGRS